MPEVIAIAGRRLSGKSTASQHLIQQGYQRISFAGYLKKTIAILYSIPEEHLSDQEIKEKVLETPLPWDANTRTELGKIIQESVPEIEHPPFQTYREAMQFIGTEVCRAIDIQFHVKKTLQSLEAGKKYVIDDLRYQNEKEALDQIGAWSTFLVRPIRNISLHTSENSLFRFHFSRTLINERDPAYLIAQLQGFLDGSIKPIPQGAAAALPALLLAAMNFPGLQDFNSTLDFTLIPHYLKHWFTICNSLYIEDVKSYFYQKQGENRVFAPSIMKKVKDYNGLALDMIRLGEALTEPNFHQRIVISL